MESRKSDNHEVHGCELCPFITIIILLLSGIVGGTIARIYPDLFTRIIRTRMEILESNNVTLLGRYNHDQCRPMLNLTMNLPECPDPHNQSTWVIDDGNPYCKS